MEKEIKDIEDINNEFKKLNSEIGLLENRLIAVGIDYMYYINSNISQDFLMELRDNIMYRLFSSKFHIELLLVQLSRVNQEILFYLENHPEEFLRNYQPIHPYFEKFQMEISSIFDSFVYHTVSIFDYISSLVQFVCFQKQEISFKWNSLARSSFDPKNALSERPIAQLINNFHVEYVTKLIKYRSLLIHERGDLLHYSFSKNFLNNDFKIKFFSTQNFLKIFPELKKESELYKFSILYSIFWIQKKTLKITNDILFALKKDMESNPQIPHGLIVHIDKDTGKISSTSRDRWFEDEYNSSI